MGKILGSWSGMRKYLEQEMLADPLRRTLCQRKEEINEQPEWLQKIYVLRIAAENI